MRARFVGWGAGMAALASGAFLACSSHYAASFPDADADVPTNDGGADADALETSADASDAAPGDPCADGGDPSAEYAGLYVVDGYIPDQADGGGAFVTRSSVLRAPLHCDGSMGAFVEIGTPPARPSYGGNAVTFGGQSLLLNGLSDTQPDLVDFAYAGVPSATGSIESYLATNGVVDPPSWRFALAATGSRAYVLGGEAEDGTLSSDVKMLTFTAGGSSPTLQATALAPLPEPLDRVAAAIAHDTLVVYGGRSVYWAPLAADGTFGPWSALPPNPETDSQFDGVAAADDDNVYLIGGEQNEQAFGWLDCTQSPPAYHPGVSIGGADPVGLSDSVSTTSRGFVYLLPFGSATFTYAKLQVGSLDLRMGTMLPEARRNPALFVY